MLSLILRWSPPCFTFPPHVAREHKDSDNNRWRHRWCECIVTKQGSARLGGEKKDKNVFIVKMQSTPVISVYSR